MLPVISIARWIWASISISGTWISWFFASMILSAVIRDDGSFPNFIPTRFLPDGGLTGYDVSEYKFESSHSNSGIMETLRESFPNTVGLVISYAQMVEYILSTYMRNLLCMMSDAKLVQYVKNHNSVAVDDIEYIFYKLGDSVFWAFYYNSKLFEFVLVFDMLGVQTRMHLGYDIDKMRNWENDPTSDHVGSNIVKIRTNGGAVPFICSVKFSVMELI